MSETPKLPKGTITYTLLVWEQTDLRALFALIPNSALDEDAHVLLTLVHARCLNADTCTQLEADAIITVRDALTREPKNLSAANPVGSKWAQRFTQYIVDRGDGEPIEGRPLVPLVGKIITHVYRTGWY